MNLTDCIVFTGSTTTVEEARQILPNAAYHLPIKCGDIFRVLRLNPKIIIIIDGYFEQSGSVWHKEILFAISKGIKVFGASSMGALRAAELCDYGMIGSGKIYSAYANNEIIDDDEVAVTFSAETQSSLPLVNVRFTLEYLIENNLLEEDRACDILEGFKKIPYFQRHLKTLGGIVADDNLMQLIEKNYINQKKQDAIQLLTHIAENKVFIGRPNPPILNSTFFIRKLYREITHSPFETDYDWLPQAEKQLCEMQESNKLIHMKILSKLFHCVYDVMRAKNSLLKHCSLDEIMQHAFSCSNKTEYERIFKFYLANSNLMADFKDKSPRWQDVQLEIHAICILFCFLMMFVKEQGFDINSRHQQLFFENFRRKNQLFSEKETRHWLAQNNIETEQDYDYFLWVGALFQTIVESNNIEFFGIAVEMDSRAWLSEVVSYHFSSFFLNSASFLEVFELSVNI